MVGNETGPIELEKKNEIETVEGEGQTKTENSRNVPPTPMVRTSASVMEFIETCGKFTNRWFTPNEVTNEWNKAYPLLSINSAKQFTYDVLNLYSGNHNSNGKKAELDKIKLKKIKGGQNTSQYCLINSVAVNEDDQKESGILETTYPSLIEINNLRNLINIDTTDLMVIGNTTDSEAGCVYLWCNQDNFVSSFFQLTLGKASPNRLCQRIKANPGKAGINVKVLAVFVDKNIGDFETYLKKMLSEFLVKNFMGNDFDSDEIFYSNRDAILKLYHLFKFNRVNQDSQVNDILKNIVVHSINMLENLIKLEHQLGTQHIERKVLG